MIELLFFFFSAIILNSLLIFGMYVATRENNLLEAVQFLSLAYLGEKISKAVCQCPPCMASLHSLWVWIPVYGMITFTPMLIYVHLVYILCLSGLNKLIVSLKWIDL